METKLFSGLQFLCVQLSQSAHHAFHHCAHSPEVCPLKRPVDTRQSGVCVLLTQTITLRHIYKVSALVKILYSMHLSIGKFFILEGAKTKFKLYMTLNVPNLLGLTASISREKKML